MLGNSGEQAWGWEASLASGICLGNERLLEISIRKESRGGKDTLEIKRQGEQSYRPQHKEQAKYKIAC